MKNLKIPRLAFFLALFIAGLLMAMPSFAQTETVSSVELVKDSRIDVLAKKQSQINKVASYKTSRGGFKGYRIMVINTNNREAYNATRTTLLRNYPEHKIYTSYQAPYFKIKLGDFLKKEDAEKLKKELSRSFKHGLFVMQDVVKLKPEDEARLLAEEEDN